MARSDEDAACLREVLSTERAAPFFAAVRLLEVISLNQARVARNLGVSATRLMARLRAELESQDGSPRDAGVDALAGGRESARAESCGLSPVCTSLMGKQGMASNPHFISAESWAAAAVIVGFEPRIPEYTVDCELGSLEVWVRDHKMREVGRARRSLEAHYGRFVFTQSKPGEHEAMRLAMETSYGSSFVAVTVMGREGRSHPLGPPPGPDDTDGRSPAVVVWADGPKFYLLASDELDADVLSRVAGSLRDVGHG